MWFYNDYVHCHCLIIVIVNVQCCNNIVDGLVLRCSNS